MRWGIMAWPPYRVEKGDHFIRFSSHRNYPQDSYTRPWPTVIRMKRTRGLGGDDDDHNPVAWRPPTRPIGRPVCALAPDADTPLRAHSPRALGARRGVGLGVAARPRGQTVAGACGGPQKTDDDPARVDHGGAPHLPRLCGSATGALMAPGPPHDT